MKTLMIGLSAALLSTTVACRNVDDSNTGVATQKPVEGDTWSTDQPVTTPSDTTMPSAVPQDRASDPWYVPDEPAAATGTTTTTPSAGVTPSAGATTGTISGTTDTTTDTTETADDPAFFEVRTNYDERARARLSQIDAKLRELEARSDAEAREAAAELRVRRDQLATRLDSIGSQMKAGWNEFQSDVSRSFDELERDLDARF